MSTQSALLPPEEVDEDLDADEDEEQPEETLYAFREDVKVYKVGMGDDTRYRVVDPVSGASVVLGGAEIIAAKQFDGYSTLDEICQRLAAQYKVVLSKPKLRAFLKRLRDLQIITEPGEVVSWHEAGVRMAMQEFGPLGKLLVIPTPLAFDPDRLLTKMAYRLKFIFTPGFVVFCLGLFLLAAQVWLDQWPRILLQAKAVEVSFVTAATFYFAFALSISVHEMAHGLVMKAFRGRVMQMGIMFYYMSLTFYTRYDDESIGAGQRKKEALVVLGGPIASFLLCFLGTLCWRFTVPGSLINHLFFVMMSMNATISILTLLPWTKGDGYQLLRTILDKPNMRERAFEFTEALLAKIFLLSKEKLPEATRGEAWFFVIYYVIAFIWNWSFNIVVGYALLSWLFNKLEAAGLLIALLLVISRYWAAVEGFKPLRRLKRLAKARREGRLKLTELPTRALARLRAAAGAHKAGLFWTAAVAALLLLVPFDVHVNGRFDVVSQASADVRASVGGIVTRVEVTSGQAVQPGQLLAVVVDPELQLELSQIRSEIHEADARLELLLRGARSEEVEIARAGHQLAELSVQHARTELARQRALFERKMVSAAEVEAFTAKVASLEKAEKQRAQHLALVQKGARTEEIDAARADLDALKHREQLLSARIARGELKAASAGIVSTAEQQLQSLRGRSVAPGEMVLQVVAADQLIARIDVPESEADVVQPGQRIELRPLERLDRPLSASVEYVDYAQDAAAKLPGMLSVIARLDAGQRGLKLGASGVAKIEGGRKSTLSVITRRLLAATYVRFWSWW